MAAQTKVKSPDVEDRTLTTPACVSRRATWYA